MVQSGGSCDNSWRYVLVCTPHLPPGTVVQVGRANPRHGERMWWTVRSTQRIDLASAGA